jgi:hypothetical protein
MSGFTAEELRTAIDKFLLSNGVSVPRRAVTGSRDVTAIKTVVYELLTTALLLRPESFFYLSWLASNRIRALVSQQIEDIEALLVDAEGVSRPSRKIESTAELTNATAALLNINGALNEGTNGTVKALGPEVDRFQATIDKFARRELAKNVVVAGIIQPTAEELRKQVLERWAGTYARHTSIEESLGYLDTGLSLLGAAALPEAAVRGIVSRITTRLGELEAELSGSGGIAASRLALLDLLAMKTVLVRSSSFRIPTLTLLETQGTLGTSGYGGSIVGSVSGPYNADGTETIALTVDGVVLPPFVFAGEPGSRAELRSNVLSFPSGPGGGSTCAVAPDYGAYVTTAGAASYADGPTAAAALDAGLAGVSVTFDITTDELVFRSDETGDASHLRFRASNAAEEAFVDWAFGGAVPKAAGVPVDATEVLDAFVAVTEARVVRRRSEIGAWTMYRSSIPGEEAYVWETYAEGFGAGFTSDGTTTLVATTNLQAAGVTPGMTLVVLSPPAASGSYEVISVSANVLVVDAPVAATAAPWFYIGPDRTVPVGARVQVTAAGDNAGYYRVVSSGAGYIELDPPLREEELDLRVRVFSDQLDVVSNTISPIGTLAAVSSELGWSGTSTAEILTLNLSDNALDAGAVPGDSVFLVDPSLNPYTRVLAAVGASAIELETPVPGAAGTWSLEIRSYRYERFIALREGLNTYRTSVSSLSALDAVVGRVVRGAAFSSSIEAPLTAYLNELVVLRDLLDDYVIPRERVIDTLVNTFREQGFDRALDMLMQLRVSEVLSMGVDDVSYATHLIRSVANAAALVAPISKFAKGPLVIQEQRSLGFSLNPFDPIGSGD